jgi:hypothetical protein
MASMSAPDEDLDLRRDSERLGREIAQMQTDLDRVIQVAGLKNDPTLPLVTVLFSSLRLQWRLHNQAVRYFHDASDRLDSAYRDTIKKTDLVIKQGEVALQTKQAGIIEQLTPQLARTITDTVRQQVKVVKFKTVAAWSAAVLAIALLPCAFTYAAGLNAGRTQGEVAAHTIQAAMAAGPDAAVTWSILMADNNPIFAMAACRKSVAADADGRRYCSMPVWIDPLSRGPG